MGFLDFLNAVKNAEFTFPGIWEWIKSIYNSVITESDFVGIWEFISDKYNSYLISASVIAVALGVIIAFVGERVAGFVKFSLFFVLGFSIGICYLSPVIPEGVEIKSWIVGLVVGIVAAVLYKYLYYVLLVSAVGYSVYYICYSGAYLVSLTGMVQGKMVPSIIVAVIGVVLVLILNKWIERILTAALGGYLVAVAFNYGIYDYTSFSFLLGIEWVGILVVAAVIAIAGFAVQVKNRDVY